MAFLMNIYGESYLTNCNLSSNLPILIPLLIGECDPTDPQQRTKTGKIEDLWACAKDADEGFISWEVTLDNRTLFKKGGKEQVNLDLLDQILVRNSSPFNITFTEINKFKVEPGVYTRGSRWLLFNTKPVNKGRTQTNL
jgi:hypothetical protein